RRNKRNYLLGYRLAHIGLAWVVLGALRAGPGGRRHDAEDTAWPRAGGGMRMRRHSRGRPRLADAIVVRQIGEQWIVAGRRQVSLLDLVTAVQVHVPCSRATAYRMLHRACDAGFVNLPGFGKPAKSEDGGE